MMQYSALAYYTAVICLFVNPTTLASPHQDRPWYNSPFDKEPSVSAVNIFVHGAAATNKNMFSDGSIGNNLLSPSDETIYRYVVPFLCRSQFDTDGTDTRSTSQMTVSETRPKKGLDLHSTSWGWMKGVFLRQRSLENGDHLQWRQSLLSSVTHQFIPRVVIFDKAQSYKRSGLISHTVLIRGGVDEDEKDNNATKASFASRSKNLRDDEDAKDIVSDASTKPDAVNETLLTENDESRKTNEQNSVIENKTGRSANESLSQEENLGATKSVILSKERGVTYSFWSFFRTTSAHSDATEKETTRSDKKANEGSLLPHGPSGRGGGTLATYPSGVPSSLGDEHDVNEACISSFLSTSSGSNVINATVNITNKLSSTTSNGHKKRNDASAFVAPFITSPPSQEALPLIDDRAPLNNKMHDEKELLKTSQTTKKEVIKENVVNDKIKPFKSNTRNAGARAIVATMNKGENVSSKLLSNETAKLSFNSTSYQTETSSWLNETKAQNSYDSGDYSSTYTSSGLWIGIDAITSLGLSTVNDNFKISRMLRPIRKATAKATGLHGFLSGKDKHFSPHLNTTSESPSGRASTVISIDEELGIHNAVTEAEVIARRVRPPPRRRRRDGNNRNNPNRPRGKRWGFGGLRRGQGIRNNPDYLIVPARDLDLSADEMEQRRRRRVEEIDRLIQRGSARLLELQCEKDDLQCRPNPLFNYTKKYDPSTNQTFGDVRTSREFNFPPSELVNEYIDELVNLGRLILLNHTELWQSRSDSGFDDDDEIVGDDILTPSADARKLYENLDQLERGVNDRDRRINTQNSGGGSWLLRTGFGRNGGSLGEKLGETIETATYKAVCSAVMSILARILSALHGTNVMAHSDIRLFIERDSDLPPLDKKFAPLNGDNYAQEAIKTAIRKGVKKKKKGSKSLQRSANYHGHEFGDDAFIQRDAVVETLISHCQISAPLLKLFPLDWQRAMVGNIITLVTAIISDFADGIQVQVLGHVLSCSFKPITEADMIQHIGAGGFRQNHRRTRPEEFEAAVWATAQDISKSLTFLDGWLEWFERKLGGGILRSQIGNLIARVVLTLIDEILSGARLDLWSSQVNGPRLFAALEYRTSPDKRHDIENFV